MCVRLLFWGDLFVFSLSLSVLRRFRVKDASCVSLRMFVCGSARLTAAFVFGPVYVVRFLAIRSRLVRLVVNHCSFTTRFA